MEHTASTLRRCLLLATLTGCGTSNAFVPGIPVGGQPVPETRTPIVGASIGAGPALQPPASPLSSAGIGGSVMPSTMLSTSAGMPAALSIAAASVPAGASGGVAAPASGQGCRQAKYSLAVRLTVDMHWDETIALMPGSEKLYHWSKLTIDPGASTVSEFRACGTLPPAYRSTAVAGNITAFQRVPLATYDLPTMPFVAGGMATRVGSALMLLPGPLLIGLSLLDPAGPWPASSAAPNVMPVDADADGKRGVTSLVRNDAKFTGTPTSILAMERVDAMYTASRLAFRATLNDATCTDTLEGTAELLAMDTLLLGCHVKDRDDCRAEELSFIEENRPRFKFGSAAIAHAVVIPVDASCAQAVKVLEVPGP